MDTDNLSRETYEGVIEEAEQFDKGEYKILLF